MANVYITSPAEYYPNPDQSRPLFNGQMYIGEPDLDPEIPANQIQVNALQENGSLVPVAQPISISPGGVPVDSNGDVYIRLIVDQNYSQKVLDSQGQQKYYIPDAFLGAPISEGDTIVVYNYATLNDAVISTGLTEGMALNIAERSSGNGGGAMWDVVLASTVTPNTYNIVQCTGVPTLALVLRMKVPESLLALGLVDDWDFETQTGTDNSALYQTICRAMQDGEFNHVYFPKREGKAFYFAPQAGKSTCVFLKKDPVNFTANPNPCIVSGNGVIAVDNNGHNNVWMSSPDDVDGTTSSDVVTDFHIEGNLTITSAYLTAADRVTYDSPQTTLPNFGIGFNIGRWWRSSFKANFEFVKGIVQAPPADGLYDSTNGFIQQVKIYDCRSTHAQENFIEVTQGWSTDIIFNTVERGNGGIDMQRSSGQSFYRTNVNGNTFQGNGGGSAGALYTFRCNFGVSFTFTSNYFESNRSASGVAAVHVRMSPNNIQNLNSFTFEGNFFAQSDANLDGFGAEYAHVELDAFKNFFPKGNNFTGGNGYKFTNSTGRIYSQNETYTLSGTIYPEGQVATTNSDIPGAVQLGSVYQDTDNESVVSCTKYRSGIANMTIQQAQIAAGGSFDFRKPTQGICIISSDPANVTTALGAQAMFAVSGNTVAPEGLALSASNVYVFSVSPTAPAASTFDVAVNASNDRITVQNGFGSSREVTLITIGNGDWV